MITFKKDLEYYNGVNMMAYSLVRPGTTKVLDIGCGTGLLGKKLKEEKGVESVIGIEKVPEIAREAKLNIDRVYTTDIETTRLDNLVKHFDCIIMSHILHHLRDPWTVIKIYKNYLKDDGYIIASIPNVGHISIIQGLLQGKWEYSTSGLLDVCHMKFFTLEEMTKMFMSSGLKITAIREESAGVTNENKDFVTRLSAAVNVHEEFKKDAFVHVFTTQWEKA